MTGTGLVRASVPAGSAVNSFSTANLPSSSTDNTVTFDGTAPTVSVNQGSSQPDPTNQSPILFEVNFSEPVIGFTAADVSFAGSTFGGTLVANVSGGGAS